MTPLQLNVFWVKCHAHDFGQFLNYLQCLNNAFLIIYLNSIASSRVLNKIKSPHFFVKFTGSHFSGLFILVKYTKFFFFKLVFLSSYSFWPEKYIFLTFVIFILGLNFGFIDNNRIVNKNMTRVLHNKEFLLHVDGWHSNLVYY